MVEKPQKTILEVALNGPWGKERQPLIPIHGHDIIADAIACANEGADIVHLHAYDEETGKQCDDWETYAHLIEEIRSEVDAPVYPTIPLAGSGFAGATMSAKERYAHLEELAKRGLVEWAVVDPGSVNFLRVDEEKDDGFVYLNPNDHIREGLRICGTFGVRPSYAIYEPGFTRIGARLASEQPDLWAPVYRFMFSDQFAWGFPPWEEFLDTHIALLDACAPGAEWMIAGLGVDIRPLIPAAVARGGMVRVGLEDAPLGTDMSNVEWVRAARRLIDEAVN